MIEIKGDLFSQDCDAICITTNGYVKNNGELVMGRGCALEAKKKWPRLPKQLGELVYNFGNECFYLQHYKVISFPVKHKWNETADNKLIEKSCYLLMDIIDEYGLSKVILPRPGCGNGKLKWEHIGPFIKPILDDRVYVITNE